MGRHYNYHFWRNYLVLFILLIHLVNCDKFCGTDLSDVESTCWQPCGSDKDCCSLGQRCFEAGSSCGSSDLSGTNHFFCGVSWCDAAYKCGTPCANPDDVCPDGEYCWADIPCNSDSPTPAPPLPPPPTSSPYQFCGTAVENAQSNCWQPCPRGNSDCCLGLTCHDTQGMCDSQDYEGTNHFFCGRSWCEAAYTCDATCPGGTDLECPEGQYCYADVPCDSQGGSVPPVVNPGESGSAGNTESSSGTKYCGRSAADATERCWQSCDTDSDCCFDQLCFDTGAACGPPYYDGPNHSYCGITECDAINKCSVPCPNGNECPTGELCFDKTPCDSDIPSTQPFYCGLGPMEAADKCWQPCPSGQDSECCFGQTCYDTGGSCLTSIDTSVGNKFCGTDSCDAAYKCLDACDSDTDCPSGEQCFETPCSSSESPPNYEFAYCGLDAIDAEENCWLPCRNDDDCCFNQQCFPSTTSCGNPNFQGSAHFFCGQSFCDAANRCAKPCPSGFNAECDGTDQCYANTPCDSGEAGYGVPRSIMSLAIQFAPEQEMTPANAAYSSVNSVIYWYLINLFSVSLSWALVKTEQLI